MMPLISRGSNRVHVTEMRSINTELMSRSMSVYRLSVQYFILIFFPGQNYGLLTHSDLQSETSDIKHMSPWFMSQPYRWLSWSDICSQHLSIRNKHKYTAQKYRYFKGCSKIWFWRLCWMRDCRLPPRYSWSLRSSGMLRGFGWYYVTDVSGLVITFSSIKQSKPFLFNKTNRSTNFPN